MRLPRAHAMSETRRRICVLVVEDDADQRFLIEHRLQDVDDVEVTLAASGGEALASLEGIDLVLLDYRLPDMTGLETLQAIRAANGPSVMMVTAMGSESVAVEAMRSGAIDYVIKDATYLRNLPEIIERGWRQHDLTRRAGRLQKLALVVSEAEERDEMLSEIIHGAKELLGAEVCALAVPEDGAEPRVVASTSEEAEMPDDLMSHVRRVLASRTIENVDSLLLVPLTKQDDEAVGVLIILGPAEVSLRPEEVQLAETFASFGALALRKLRRRELEKALVDELQTTLELRQDFINSVSHELRTPLACISGFSTTLINYWGRLDDETTLSSIEKISHHAADLAKLVDALLDFGALEHGRFGAEIEPVQLDRDVALIVEGLQPLLAERVVHLDVPEVTVLADRPLLKRILINLFSNSIKASDAGSAITVRADVGEMVQVQVSDEGVGLSQTELEHVFDPFWRSRGSVKTAKRGAGIGLTLVREYVRTMGGQVDARSTVGRGATFTFTLPRA